MKQTGIVALLPLVALLGCEPVFQHSAERQIMVDSIVAPDTVNLDELVAIEFYGTIGENHCWYFHEFRNQRTSAERLEVRVMVRYRQETGGCTPGPVNLDGREFTVYPPHPGSFRVVVLQPTADSLEHVINVR